MTQYILIAPQRSPWFKPAEPLAQQSEIIMIAHKKTQDDSQSCTINEGITVSDVCGFGRGAITTTLQSLHDVEPPPGAPNGGPHYCFPGNVLIVLVNR